MKTDKEAIQIAHRMLEWVNFRMGRNIEFPPFVINLLQTRIKSLSNIRKPNGNIVLDDLANIGDVFLFAGIYPSWKKDILVLISPWRESFPRITKFFYPLYQPGLKAKLQKLVWEMDKEELYNP